MKKAFVGLALFSLLLVFSIIFASFSSEVDLALRLSEPSLSAPFGYDTLGRNLLERISAGVLVSLSIALAVAFLSIFLGLLIAYFMSLDSAIASVFMVICNSLKVIPSIILALFLAAISGPGVLKLIIALSVAMVSNVARTVFLKIKVISREGYIKVSEGFGIGRTRIFFSHILPELFPYLREQGLSIILSTIIAESSLSYLGCGVGVTTPSLGGILAEGRPFLLTAPWLVVFPSLALFLLGLSLSLISRGLARKSEFDSSS